MFKRLSNKVLLPVFLILLVVFVVLEYGGIGKEKAPIPPTLGKVDTSAVKLLKIHQGKEKSSFALMKKKGDWKLEREGNLLNANDPMVENAISDLNGLSPKQLVARDSSKWKKYQVEGSGKRIELEGAKGTLLDLRLGKMAVSKPDGGKKRRMMRRRRRPDIKFHVRKTGGSKVYTVAGRPMMRFRRGADAWIDGTIIDGPKMKWKGLTLRSPDSSLTLKKKKEDWSSQGASLDSSSIQSYLDALVGLQSKKLAKGVKTGSLKKAELRLRIRRKKKGPIKVKAYPAKGDTSTSFYVKSSMNPGMVFRDPDSSLYRKMIPGGSEENTPTPRRRMQRTAKPIP